MTDLIGWIGSIVFAICGVPQAFKCYMEGHARGVSTLFLLFWLTGELCYVYSTWAKFGWVDWLMFNYAGNILCVVIISYYKIFPRNSTTIQ